jgi:Homeodomain-like domain
MVLRDVTLGDYTDSMDEIPELLERLRSKGWPDKQIGEAIGKPRETVYRWRTQKMPCQDVKLVGDALRRLLRRVGPPQKARPEQSSRAQQPSPKHH